MTSEEREALDATYRRRGSTARSWICEKCGADVDSSDLRLHVLEHEAVVERQEVTPFDMTAEEIKARTAARMEHLKQILSPEEWAQVVGAAPDEADDEPPVDAAAAITEALNEFNRLADEHWQAADPLAAVADALNRWAVARADELTVRQDCAECGGRHTQYEYDDEHRNDEGGY